MKPHPRQVRTVRHDADTVRAARAREPLPFKAAVFAIRLPFDLPVVDGATFVMRRSIDDDEPPWAELTIRRVKVPAAEAILKPYDAGLALVLGEDMAPDITAGYSSQTWAMVAVTNVLFEDEPRERAHDETAFLTILFERCVSAVNRLTEASRLITRETDSRPLNKEALDPFVSWYEVDLDTGNFGKRNQLRLHQKHYNPVFVGYETSDARTTIATAVAKGLASDAAAQPHPLRLPRVLALEAQGLLKRGEATASIVVLQSSAEGLLRGLHRVLLVDTGAASDAIETRLDVPFEPVMKTHLPDLLGGNWTSPRSKPAAYIQRLYAVRNRIVHAGLAPGWDELAPAFNAYQELVAFLDQRVVSRWRKHPRTLAAWCEPWTGGSLQIPPKAAGVISELLAEEHPYWLPADMADR